MKTVNLTLILALISVTNLFAQSYQTISSNKTAYFKNQNNGVKCVRIDSVKIQTDSILYPFYVIQHLNDDCFSPSVASWIGKSVTIKENGINEFVNKNNEIISLNTNAVLGEKWIAFQREGSLIIEATVIDHDTMSFLSLKDSVKTIGFQAYDKDMNPLDFEINTLNIKISKNYGFVKTFNFYLFPNFQVEFPSEQFEEYELVGLSNPKVGIQNLTWFEVNDFQVGDELHVLNRASYWNGDAETDGYETTEKTIYKYLERANYTDSIVYHYARKQSVYTTNAAGNSFKYYDDTVRVVVKSDPSFDKLPGERIATDNGIFNYYMTNNQLLCKTNPSGYESFGLVEGSCWQLVIADGCLTNDEYLKGLGGPYYSCTQSLCLGSSERKLVYYKKGETTWGTPLIVTGISDLKTVNNISIYPNPACDYINVSFEDNIANCAIYIYNIQGKLQKSKKLEANHSTMDVSDLHSGVYILKIADNEKVLKIGKLVVK